MQTEERNEKVNGITMTTAEKTHYDAWVEMDDISESGAREVVEMVRRLGLMLDITNLRANRKIINAGKKVRQEATTKANEETDLKEKLKHQTEKLAASEFMRAHPEFKPSLAAQASYKQFAEKQGLTEMSPQSLEGWWANHKQEFLPKPPAPPPPPPDLRPKLVSLPAHLAQYEILKTKADVRNLSVDQLLAAQKIPEVKNRIGFILRNQL